MPPDGEHRKSLMLWFYTRDRDSLSLETRYDYQTLEYLAILKYHGGPQETQRFQSAHAFRDWLVSFDQRLVAERWAQQGAPQILPDGWPHKTPTR